MSLADGVAYEQENVVWIRESNEGIASQAEQKVKELKADLSLSLSSTTRLFVEQEIAKLESWIKSLRK